MVKKCFVLFFFKLNGKKCLYLRFLDSARNEISELEAYSLGCTIEIHINNLEKVEVEVGVGTTQGMDSHRSWAS